jgi:hypothetical protein
MAGFYPDAPAPRMAYDLDGTVGFTLSGSTPSVMSQTTLNNGNLDNSGVWLTDSANYTRIGLIFPQLRDVVGFVALIRNETINFETSTNTTNGSDGTWSSAGSYASGSLVDIIGYKDRLRTVQTVNWTGIKAVRFFHSGSTFGNVDDAGRFHLYGNIVSGETVDRLRIWHPTLDEPLDDNTSADASHLDWADVVRGTTADKTFRVKNNSATLTANSVNITTNVLHEASPTIASQITYSSGGSFASSVNLGNLAPGAISSLVTVRRNTPTNAQLSVWWWRTQASAGSWT